MSNLMTLAEVKAMAPGDKTHPVWIEGGFSAVCQKVELKNYGEGKKIWPCTFSDENGDNAVEITFFTAPKFKQGDAVQFSGKGMRRTQYNGSAKVDISKDTVISVSVGKQAIAAAVHGAKAEQQNGSLLSGAQVGMAVKESIALLTRTLEPSELSQALKSPAWWTAVYETASDVIRLGRLLESGKLADPVRVRKGQGQSQPAPRPQAPSHDPERELNEDVPF